MAVKPADDGEVIAAWGFPDERQSWTWDEPNRLMQVNIYSSTFGACVVLALNGVNLTDSCTPVSRATDYKLTVKVPYEPGTLTATALSTEGTMLATRTFKTAGEATQLRLVADKTKLRLDRSDLSYVTAEILDANGVLVACANESVHSVCVPPTIRFAINGDAEIAAVGSGDPIDPSSFHAVDADGMRPRKSYRGRATAIIRPGKGPVSTREPQLAGRVSASAGTVTITAKAAGLASATLEIEVGNKEA